MTLAAGVVAAVVLATAVGLVRLAIKVLAINLAVVLTRRNTVRVLALAAVLAALSLCLNSNPHGAPKVAAAGQAWAIAVVTITTNSQTF